MKTREEWLKELDEPETLASKSPFLDDWNTQRKIGIDGVKDILHAPTQEQLDCLYCHGTDNLNDTTDRNNDFQIKIDLYDPDDARLNVEYRGGADYEIAHINYCPQCGRKLGDE